MVTVTLAWLRWPFTRMSPPSRHFAKKARGWSGKAVANASNRLTGVALWTRRKRWAA